MNATAALVAAFENIASVVHGATGGLTPEQLSHRLDAEANSIGWLVWHLSRVQDDHVAGVAGHEQVWTADGWARRFGLPFPDSDIGYGQGATDVAAVRVPADLLLGYHDAVHERTASYLAGLSDDDLERIVDHAWDPAVTLGVRLVSVVTDDLEHAGQAAFVRGVVERR